MGHRIEICACGNVLDECHPKCGESQIKIYMHPCWCKAPGPGRRQLTLIEPLPDYVSERQFNQRREFGLPVATDLERAFKKRWA